VSRRTIPQRTLIPAIAVATLLSATAMTAAAEGDFDFVDTTDFPTLRLVVTPPPAATPDEMTALHVFQDGQERPAAVLPLQASPLEMVVLVDASGSMAGAAIEAAKQAAIDFVDSLPPGSDVSILAFGNEVTVVTEPGVSRDELVTAVGAIRAQGETALYDAVIAAATLVDHTIRTRQFVVVLSDGGDTVSTATLADVTQVLDSIPMGFYAIELAGSEPDPAALAAMAETTGGSVVPASDASGLSATYAEIARTVVSQYAVVFDAMTGGQSTIEVVLVVAGEEIRLSADLTLPAMPGTNAGVVITIAPPSTRSLTPPVTYVYPGPGRLQQDWALRTGAVLVGVTLLILFGYALQPAEGRPARSQLATLDASSTGRRGWRWRRRRQINVPGTALQDRSQGSARRRGIDAALDAAGVAISSGEYLAIVTVTTLGGLALGILMDSPLLGLLLLTGAIVLPRAFISRAARKRRGAFADQLEGTLQLISGSMRAGYGLVSAMSTVATEAPSPTSDEFGRVVIETRVGRDLTTALRGVADRMRNDDLAWVTDAIAIQQEVGGNLAEVLDAVGATIRDRNQIRRQVHALSAEGRFSAVILIALPFVLAGVISLVNPGYLNALFDSTIGKALVLVGAVLMTLGVIWIRRIVKIVF
jgi:tight adherence protein B